MVQGDKFSISGSLVPEFLKVLLKDPTSRFEVGLKAISESFFLKFARSHLLVKTGDGLLTPDFIT